MPLDRRIRARPPPHAVEQDVGAVEPAQILEVPGTDRARTRDHEGPDARRGSGLATFRYLVQQDRVVEGPANGEPAWAARTNESVRGAGHPQKAKGPPFRGFYREATDTWPAPRYGEVTPPSRMHHRVSPARWSASARGHGSVAAKRGIAAHAGVIVFHVPGTSPLWHDRCLTGREPTRESPELVRSTASEGCAR